MLFELTNEERIAVGLTQVEETWERMKLRHDIYLYFDNDRLVKRITVTQDSYHEIELNDLTASNRTMLLPRTSKGKAKKLNYSAVQALGGIGVYFAFYNERVWIANYSTQTTFFETDFKVERIVGLDGLKKWLGWWINDTTESDQRDIELFRTAVRRHCKYKEGDYFAFRTGRRQFGFGRILLDVSQIRNDIKSGAIKEKHYGLMNLMGKALIVKVYKKTSPTIEVDINELKQCEAYCSTPIMDNVFYYGEYKIIGNQKLEPFELEFPISYSRSIDWSNPDIVYLQYGLIYKELPISKFSKYLRDPEASEYISGNPYRNERIGFRG